MLEKFVKKVKNLSPEFKRYLAIGFSVYALELVVIVVALKMGAGNIVAVAYSFWIGLGASFLLQKLVTFGDKRMHHKILVPQIIAYCLLVLFNFIITILLVKILTGILPAAFTRTFAIGLTTIWNFYLYRTRIFKSNKIIIANQVYK